MNTPSCLLEVWPNYRRMQIQVAEFDQYIELLGIAAGNDNIHEISDTMMSAAMPA